MARDRWMEGYAQDCIRLARLTPDVGIQEELVKMAGQWMAAAAGSKQRQTTSQIRHQSTPATSVDTPRSRHVAGAKKRFREPSGRLQPQNAPGGPHGGAAVIGRLRSRP
jgi:hypothetical protein